MKEGTKDRGIRVMGEKRSETVSLNRSASYAPTEAIMRKIMQNLALARTLTS